MTDRGLRRRAKTRTFLYMVGARPNFMKVAPVLAAMRRRAAGDRHVLVHTGQHYDRLMSQTFFEELDLPDPDYNLAVGAVPGRAQVGVTLRRLLPVVTKEEPTIIVVAGDVNSTLAGGLAAAQMRIPLAHIEAGLRSFDLSMEEEVNRIIVDHASSLLFIHSPEARENLIREGIDQGGIHFVGNTMIDTLIRVADQIDAEAILNRYGIATRYLLVTLHRPALVDGPLLGRVLKMLDTVAEDLEVVFPVHPRTARAVERTGAPTRRLRLMPPASVGDFLALQKHAAAVLTDSGGVQEETTFLGVPCFTLRDNTERPITLTQGTNHLLGLRPERILEIPRVIDSASPAPPPRPRGWDGRASQRIAAILDGGASR